MFINAYISIKSNPIKLVFVVIDPRNLHLKFGKNQISNCWGSVVVVVVVVPAAADVVVAVDVNDYVVVVDPKIIRVWSELGP